MRLLALVLLILLAALPARAQSPTLSGLRVTGQAVIGTTIHAAATCNGTADDTAALQAAANAIPSTGGTLVISAGSGNCMVSGPISLKSNTRVVGAGATIQNRAWNYWSPTGVGTTFLVSGVSNVTIEGMRFAYQHGTYNGGSAHIIEITNSSNVLVRNNISDGGGDFVAAIGSSNVHSDGNVVTNVDNSCFDAWGGSAHIRVTNNYCTTVNYVHSGVGAIQFTGIATGGGPATTLDFHASGNTVVINTPEGQGFILNGHDTGGADSQMTVVGNRVFINAKAWGILVYGVASHGLIADNYIEGSVNPSYSAVRVAATAAGWTVANNVAVGIQAGSNGVFANSGTGGTLVGNVAYSSSSPLLGTAGSNIVTYGNDTGTGTLNLAAVNITSGTAAFDGAVSVAGALTSLLSPSWGWNNSGGIAEVINAAAGTFRGLQFQTAGTKRWEIFADTTAEAGADAGTDLAIRAYHDNGTTIGTALAINRATRAVSFNGAPAGRFVSPPASSTATCAPGDVSADASYVYACRATNAWTRSANVGGW